MANGFLGLRVGLSGLIANQTGLNVTANNLANAGTEGYARKQVKLQPSIDLPVAGFSGRDPFVMQGSGVEVAAVVAVRDLFLNGRIRDVQTELNTESKTYEYLQQIELLFTGEVDTGTLLDNFFASLQDLANSPESITARQVVIESAETLTQHVNSTANNLISLQQRADEEIEADVREINRMAGELAVLNEKIANVSGFGVDPGDLEDRRQVLLEDLSELINIQTVPSVNNMLTVLAGGQTIVSGTQSFNLIAENDVSNNGFVRIRHADGGEVFATGGQMAGLLDVRDEIIGGVLNKLDQLAVNMIDRINATHRAGFGLDGRTGLNFFDPSAVADDPLTIFSVTGGSSGYASHPDLPLDGDPATAIDENFEANPVGIGNFVINGHSIAYDGAKDSLNEIVERINESVPTAHAYVNEQNRLVLAGNANNSFRIESIADTGNLMESLGILKAGTVYPSGTDSEGTASLAGSFQYPPAGGAARRFSVSDFLVNSPESIAAAAGIDTSVPPDGIGDVSAGPGDNTIALAMADLKFEMTMRGATASFNDFYNSVVGEIAVLASSARSSVDSLEVLEQNLLDRREEVQGVSIDEELVNMIKYQRGYQASSRIISAIDETLQILMNLGA